MFIISCEKLKYDCIVKTQGNFEVTYYGKIAIDPKSNSCCAVPTYKGDVNDAISKNKTIIYCESFKK